MTTFLIRHRVADYDAWKQVYDGAASVREGGGVTAAAIYRDCEDAHQVLVMHRFASREQGEAFIGDPGLKEALAAGGVEAASLRVEVYEDPV